MNQSLRGQTHLIDFSGCHDIIWCFQISDFYITLNFPSCSQQENQSFAIKTIIASKRTLLTLSLILLTFPYISPKKTLLTEALFTCFFFLRMWFSPQARNSWLINMKWLTTKTRLCKRVQSFVLCCRLSQSGKSVNVDFLRNTGVRVYIQAWILFSSLVCWKKKQICWHRSDSKSLAIPSLEINPKIHPKGMWQC